MKQRDKDSVRDKILAEIPKLQQLQDALLDANVKANMSDTLGIVIDRAFVEFMKMDTGKTGILRDGYLTNGLALS
ncbi:MAG: hypothetical protein M1816_005582 [Peltula sp. TS41687]|nr:MAG: hypothetical protein M1816_005582 [Peltula sp. TS41687]